MNENAAQPEAEEEVDGIRRAPVEDWMEARGVPIARPLSFERIAGGRSNLTYRVTDAAGGRWVLRRPPLGERLGSAHDMGREHKVVSALAESPVPVAPLVGLCEDEKPIGAPFYVMDFVEGPILRSKADAGAFPEEAQRRAVSERLVDTLVALHEVDPDAVGLGDLGKKSDYVARQLKRWQGQWQKSKTRELPVIDEVHRILEARIPEQARTAIVHGDYRLDNVILTPEGEVGAVVDWELCTLGDPLADVGLLMVYWVGPEDRVIPLFEMATQAPGFLSREEMARLYAERSGRDLSELDYFVALGFWKLAIILEGVLARYTAGQYGDNDDQFEQFAKIVEGLGDEALAAVKRLD